MKIPFVIGLCMIFIALPCPKVAAQNRQLTNQPHDPNRTEVLGIVLMPTGFVTPNITIKPGQYLIVLDDRSGGKPVTVQLDKSTPGVSGSLSPVTDGVAVKGRQKFQSLNKLSQGTYKLSIVEHPKWICTIEVK